MTFEEIKDHKDEFFREYHLDSRSMYPWEELLKIGEDFERKRAEGGEYFKIIQNYLTKLSMFESVHSYRYRIKNTASLLAKIVTKSEKRQEAITVDNYFREITDLLGIRILYVFKEDYWPIHTQLMAAYKNQLTEDISLKLKAGDDRSLYDKLLKSYSNVKVEYNATYRSIHYTLNAQGENIAQSPKLEIQTRSIFEEGWSEINHKLVYKQGDRGSITGLQRSSRILSELVGTCDTVGTLMKYIHDEGFGESLPPGASKQEPPEMDVVGDAVRKFLLS